MILIVNKLRKMNNTAVKDRLGCDVICKNHTARHDRDIYRICPAKLSKRELEDLYFALLENNLELKKTIHSQQDKLKVLNAKVQRLTVAQRSAAGKEKENGATKALINEQRESIAELKETNERLEDRIRVLNMRLCSAKQFLKRSPSQNRSVKCLTAITNFKNSSTSALHNSKPSETNVNMKSTSYQYINKNEPPPTRDAQTETDVPENDYQKQCNENKCRTQMEELKEKIVNLQEELSKAHEEYRQRIGKLENEVCSLTGENLVARAASRQIVDSAAEEKKDLKDRLHVANTNCNELEVALSIEKRKVAELETALRLANMSDHMAQSIDKLTALTEEKLATEVPQDNMLCRKCSEELNAVPNKAEQDETIDKHTIQKLSECNDSEKHMPSSERRVSVNLGEDYMNRSHGREDPSSSAASSFSMSPKKVSKSKTEHKNDGHNKFQIPGPIPSSPTKYTKPLKDKKDRRKSQEEKNITIGGFENIDDLSKKYKDSVHKSGTKKDGNKIDESQSKDKANNFKESPIKIHDKCKHSNDETAYNIKPKDHKARDSKVKEILESESNFNVHHPELSNGKNKRTSNVEDMIKMTSDVNESNSSKQARKSIGSENELDFIDNAAIEAKLSTSNKALDKSNFDLSILNEADLKEARNENQVRESNMIIEQTGNLNGSLSNFDLEKDRGVKNDATSAQTWDETLTGSVKDNASAVRDRTGTIKPNIDATNQTQPLHAMKENSASSVNDRKSLTTTDTFIGKADAIEISEQRLTDPRSDHKGSKTDELELMRDTSLAEQSVKIPAETLREINGGAGKELKDFDAQMDSKLDQTQTYKRDSSTYTKSPILPDYKATLNGDPRFVADGTYSLEKRDTATSPDNTDHEISSITDQLQEKFVRPVRAVLSPGEQKRTRTDTDTSHTDYGSLSEGELPNTSRARTLSDGEKPLHNHISRKSSLQVEETLQAISRELERCRRLLVDSRPQQTNTEPLEEVPLHRSPRRLPYTKPHTCVFTLHIGTLVLSDEAVMMSRDRPLVLMWKFYDQNTSMARLRPGRVILFDFSTQYDVPFSEDFLNYLKHEEMALMICEMNNQDEPIAKCSLPLREALLHTNRRADMSLALVSNKAREELGVLDLWCSLRAAPALRPRLTAQSVASISELSTKSQAVGTTLRDSRDDHSDTRLSQDFAIGEEGRRLHSSFPANRLWEAQMPVQSKRSSEAALGEKSSPKNIDSMKNVSSKPHHTQGPSRIMGSRAIADSLQELLHREKELSGSKPTPMRSYNRDDEDYSYKKDSFDKKDNMGLEKMLDSGKKSVKYTDPMENLIETPVKLGSDEANDDQSIHITVLWLALNEECEAMINPNIKRLYVAYSFLGRRGADLETPISLPKPKHYADKCYFNFKKTFQLKDADLPLLGHMSRCRAGRAAADPRDCLVFSVISEPLEDPLGLSSCEDIGYAYLYLGDILAYSAGGNGYTEVVPVRCATAVCGVLAVRVDGLHVLRRCLASVDSFPHRHNERRF